MPAVAHLVLIVAALAEDVVLRRAKLSDAHARDVFAMPLDRHLLRLVAGAHRVQRAVEHVHVARVRAPKVRDVLVKRREAPARDALLGLADGRLLEGLAAAALRVARAVLARVLAPPVGDAARQPTLALDPLARQSSAETVEPGILEAVPLVSASRLQCVRLLVECQRRRARTENERRREGRQHGSWGDRLPKAADGVEGVVCLSECCTQVARQTHHVRFEVPDPPDITFCTHAVPAQYWAQLRSCSLTQCCTSSPQPSHE